MLKKPTEFMKSGDLACIHPLLHHDFGIVLFIAATLNFKLCFSACARAEYEINGECCPMCAPGNCVYWHCTGDTSTTCVPCPASTYTDEPNRLVRCYSCSVCDAGQGLYIQSKCTPKRDTICDVLDGYYCIEDSNSQCRHAIKHRVCKPGQETKTLGTKTADTECENCSFGFYSSSGLNCTKWTDCAARNEIQSEDGSPVKDVKCVPKRKIYFLLAFCPPVICAAVLAALYGRSCSEVQRVNNGDKINGLPIEETSPEPATTGQTLEENNEKPTDDT